MGATKRIKIMLLDKGVKIQDFAGMIGKPAQSLYNQLGRDTWKFSEVETIAGVLDCEVVIRDKKTGKIY